MKLNIGKVVDKMTYESCIPTDPVKSGDDCFSLVHNIGTGYTLIRIRPIRHTWLVKVMKCRISNIRIKGGRCEVWITICIEIIVIVIHITKMLKTKTNK